MSELPDGWATATLTDLIAPDGIFTDGDWVETKDQDPAGDVRLTQLADIGDGVFRDRSSRFLRTDQAADLNCTFLEAGDVLIARMPDPLGRACVLPRLQPAAVTAVDVCVVRPGAMSVVPQWLMWTINAPQFRARVAGLQTGTTRKRISRKNLASIPLPVPPLAEQRRIVAAIEEQFSRLDAAVDSAGTAGLRLAAFRKATLARLDSLPLDHSVGDVAEIRGGIQKQPKRRPIANAHPFLRVANVLRGRLDLADVHKVELFGGELERYRLQAGDLLVVEGNGSRSQIGRSAVWRGEIEDCVHQNHLIRVRPGPRVEPDYLALYWNAPGCAERLAQVASTTSGLYTLSVSKLERLRLAVPSLDEQRRIVAELEQQLSLIDSLREAVASAQKRSAALRRAILERAFRGELVPQDPDDEPASVLLERIRAERASAPPKPRRRARV